MSAAHVRLEDCRPAVRRFAVLMEQALRRNDWKGGWKNEPPSWFFARLLEEAGDLVKACRSSADGNPFRPPDPASVAKEAADVANFCMFIADVAGALKPEEEEEP